MIWYGLIPNVTLGIIFSLIENSLTVESTFLFRDRDRPVTVRLSYRERPVTTIFKVRDAEKYIRTLQNQALYQKSIY